MGKRSFKADRKRYLTVYELIQDEESVNIITIYIRQY